MTLDTARSLLPITHLLDRRRDGLLYFQRVETIGETSWHDRLRARLGHAARTLTGHWRW